MSDRRAMTGSALALAVLVSIVAGPATLSFDQSLYVLEFSPWLILAIASLLAAYGFSLSKRTREHNGGPAFLWQRMVASFVDYAAALMLVVLSGMFAAVLWESTRTGRIVVAVTRDATSSDIIFASTSAFAAMATFFTCLILPVALRRSSPGNLLAGIVVVRKSYPNPLIFYVMISIPALFAMSWVLLGVFSPRKWNEAASRTLYDELLETEAYQDA